MKSYPQIAARVLNTPLLIEPNYARVFFSALADRLNIAQLQDAEGQIMTGEKMRMAAETWSGSRPMADSVTRTRKNKWGDEELLYHIVDGAAIIPVMGTLVHKSGFLNTRSGMTGYDGITYLTSLALADNAVKGIMLDLDTPGGEVAGCFDTSQQLRSMADAVGKPLWALCYDMNCSAGMALASAAHRRLITQTGVAGSVGVVMAHQDMSKRLDTQGINVTLIHSGAHKTDGNPYQALPDSVLNQFQQNTDQLRREFAQIVATHTGLSLENVLATEAAIYRGQEAIDIGFADELVNGHDAIPMFTQHLSAQGRTITLGATMPNPNATVTTEPAAQASAGTEPTPVTTAEPAAGIAATAEQTADFRAEERERIKLIMNHEAAASRQSLAAHLAYDTEMSVEEAAKVLAAAGEETKTSLDANTALDAMMSNEEQPNLSVETDTGEDLTDDEKIAANAVAAYRKATGAK